MHDISASVLATTGRKMHELILSAEERLITACFTCLTSAKKKRTLCEKWLLGKWGKKKYFLFPLAPLIAASFAIDSNSIPQPGIWTQVKPYWTRFYNAISTNHKNKAEIQEPDRSTLHYNACMHWGKTQYIMKSGSVSKSKPNQLHRRLVWGGVMRSPELQAFNPNL